MPTADSMRQLVFLRPGVLRWQHAPVPVPSGRSYALVRPIAVARCDLDVAIVRGRAPFRSRPLHWLRDHLPPQVGRDGIFRGLPFAGPFPFGHECVAEVLEAGPDVRSVRAGDVVVVPFQISCGVCERCRRGVTASCSAVSHGACYGLGRGFGGVLTDVVLVPHADAMLLLAPPGVSPLELASAGDNVADAVRAVLGPLEAHPSASVLVVGGAAASIGLYAVQAALALGAGAVHYLDQDGARLSTAERLGARVHQGPYRRTGSHPITVDASADPSGLAAAVRSTEPGGTCTSVGVYFAPTTPFPLLPAYMNGITFVTGRVSSRALLPRVLALIAARRLLPSKVTARVADWSDAAEAFLDGGAKVVVQRLPRSR